MSNQKDEREELPWFQKPTVLKTVDLRTYGKSFCKTDLSKLWKKGGLGVMAILRAEKAAELREKPEKPDA